MSVVPKSNLYRIRKLIWFAVVVVLVVVLLWGALVWIPYHREQVSESLPSGEQFYTNSLTAREARTTEFALLKNMLGMTRESIEREIGVGERVLAGDHHVRSHSMLFDADLNIEYEVDRAVEVWISVEDEEESYFREATGEEIEELRKALHDYEIEQGRFHRD